MNAYTMLAAGLFLSSVPTMGQSNRQGMLQEPPYFAEISSLSEDYLQKAVKNYALALTSANDGVVESSIAHLTFIRISLPQMDLKGIRATMVELAESGRTPVIRYKAYLATIVFESPVAFVRALNVESAESDQFFSSIASQVQKTLLGQNIK
jgi:hypothetical protein